MTNEKDLVTGNNRGGWQLLRINIFLPLNFRQKALDGMWMCEDWAGSFEKKSSHFAKSKKIVDLGHKKATIIDSLDNPIQP